jgi:hypothetical protein
VKARRHFAEEALAIDCVTTAPGACDTAAAGRVRDDRAATASEE